MDNDALLGQTLGDRYFVLEKTGEEMLGRVYTGRDTKQDRLVSVKVLHPYLAENPEKVRRFAREISATSAVRHPNSVQVLDYGEHQGQHFFVLEYLVGRTLQEILAEGPMPVERAASIAAQIANALDAAHAEGVVHRNLNPHNVVLLENASRGDFAKVRDFGLSKLEDAGEEDGHGLTATGARIGNTAYMAPEYIEDSVVSPQGDLYALGCLLFHMLTGRPPFEGKSGNVLMMHISNVPEVPSRLRAEVPGWMDKLVLHLLEKDPARRPHRGRIVSGALEQGVGRSLEAPKLHGISSQGEIVKTSSSGKAVMAGGAAVVLLGGVALVLLVAALGVAWMILG